jgi:hypothetical protein
VHDVTREAGRKFENSRKAAKDTGLPDPSFKPPPSIFGISRRGEHILEFSSIVCWIGVRKFVDVDIRAISGLRFARVQRS